MGRIRFEAFVAEPAATVQGLLAKLAYFDELAGDGARGFGPRPMGPRAKSALIPGRTKEAAN